MPPKKLSAGALWGEVQPDTVISETEGLREEIGILRDELEERKESELEEIKNAISVQSKSFTDVVEALKGEIETLKSSTETLASSTETFTDKASRRIREAESLANGAVATVEQLQATNDALVRYGRKVEGVESAIRDLGERLDRNAEMGGVAKSTEVKRLAEQVANLGKLPGAASEIDLGGIEERLDAYGAQIEALAAAVRADKPDSKIDGEIEALLGGIGQLFGEIKDSLGTIDENVSNSVKDITETIKESRQSGSGERGGTDAKGVDELAAQIESLRATVERGREIESIARGAVQGLIADAS